MNTEQKAKGIACAYALAEIYTYLLGRQAGAEAFDLPEETKRIANENAAFARNAIFHHLPNAEEFDLACMDNLVKVLKGITWDRVLEEMLNGEH